MKTEHVPIDRVLKLLAAARYAVKHSGDHGCSWCKSASYGCSQCAAYFRLQAALVPFIGMETPLESPGPVVMRPVEPGTLDYGLSFQLGRADLSVPEPPCNPSSGGV